MRIKKYWAGKDEGYIAPCRKIELPKIQKSNVIRRTDNQRVAVMDDLYSGAEWRQGGADCININPTYGEWSFVRCNVGM
jgi:hypothetical protein